MKGTVFARTRTIALTAIVAAAATVACSSGSKGNGGGGGTQASNIPTLASVAVNPATATGGDTVQGTVTLAAAPTVGAAVTLSSNNAAASVPASVTVNSGAMSNTFNITTSAVTASTAVTITGTLNGSQSTTLTLMPPAAAPFVARMIVKSRSAARRKTNGSQTEEIPGFPAGTLDACPLANINGNPQLDCDFDGGPSTSPSPITEYRWQWQFGSSTPASQNNSEAKFQPKVDTCGFFGGKSTGNTQSLQMKVTLIVVRGGNVLSDPAINQNVQVFPAGLCGYNF